MNAVRVLTRIAGGLMVLTALVTAAIVVHGWSRIDLPARRRVPVFRAATDSASIARGRHIVEFACSGCHSPTFAPPLTGSAINFLATDSTHAMGVLWAPNLTPASAIGQAGDGLLARAIREGVGSDGRALLIMPSARYHGMSDADLAAVIGFLHTQPPVERPLPPRKLGLTPYIVIGLHQFPTSLQPALTASVPPVPEAESPAYGRYLVSLATCQDCHGDNLRGQPAGGAGPHGPDLAGPVATLDFAHFDHAMRGGVGFQGQPLNAADMPFGEYARMTDIEARAIYAYVRSLSTP